MNWREHLSGICWGKAAPFQGDRKAFVTQKINSKMFCIPKNISNSNALHYSVTVGFAALFIQSKNFPKIQQKNVFTLPKKIKRITNSIAITTKSRYAK